MFLCVQLFEKRASDLQWMWPDVSVRGNIIFKISVLSTVDYNFSTLWYRLCKLSPTEPGDFRRALPPSDQHFKACVKLIETVACPRQRARQTTSYKHYTSKLYKILGIASQRVTPLSSVQAKVYKFPRGQGNLSEGHLTGSGLLRFIPNQCQRSEHKYINDRQLFYQLKWPESIHVFVKRANGTKLQ